MNYVIQIVNLEELDSFIDFIKKYIRVSDVVCLEGDLGAGKTTFVKAFLKSFGFYDVSSPTFSIINEYNLKDFKVIHGDFYRVENPRDFIDYIKENQNNTISFIEWPKDNICTKRLKITSIGENKRLYKLCM